MTETLATTTTITATLLLLLLPASKGRDGLLCECGECV